MKRLAAISALALVGCMDARPKDAAAVPAPGVECRADPAQRFVGRRYQPALGTRIQRRSGAQTTRVVRPGEIVTMDFRPDRVTVTLDERDVVTVIRCG